MMAPLSPRQTAVLRVMIAHLLEHHTHAPIRTIGAALSSKSTVNVCQHLAALELKGYIESRQAHAAGRTWRVLFTPEGEPFHLANVATLAPDLVPLRATEP